ncbi:hypothetical protein ElyMa_001886600 [Elysia marginata]|uniref:Uncharacterized protein n=1 Tax=Elysia marginata TaxID=1093978 RepID=A0AAV4EPG4_9GAST|nr:hypothetical protein ElyMa_001886600 [Elysia marginata]
MVSNKITLCLGILANSTDYETGTGSLTVLRRTNSRKTTTSSSRASSVSMDSIDSYASADLGVDKLPPVDTSEALHACSLR